MKLKIMIMALLLLLAGIGSAVNRLPATEFVGDIDFASGYYARNATEGIFNIVDYGAVADDATGDGVVIQQCIDAASAYGGGVVIIPGGEFLLDEFVEEQYLLRNRPNFVLSGTGTLKVGDGIRNETTPIFLLYENNGSVNIHNVTVEGITVDYNGQNNLVSNFSWTGTPVVNRFGARKCSDINVHHVTFKNTAGHHCMYWGGGDPINDSNIDIHDCLFDTVAQGIPGDLDYDHTSVYVSMSNATVHDCRFVNPDGTQDRVQNGACSAIELHGNNNHAYNNVIKNYYIGIWFTNIEDNLQTFDCQTAIGNVILGAHKPIAAFLDSGNITNVIIEGNVVTLDTWNSTTDMYATHISRAAGSAINNLYIKNNEFVGVVDDAGTNAVIPWSMNGVENLYMSGNTYDTFSSAGTINIRYNSTMAITDNIFINNTGEGAFSQIDGWVQLYLYTDMSKFVMTGNDFIQPNPSAALSHILYISDAGSFGIDDIYIANNFEDDSLPANPYQIYSDPGSRTVIIDRGEAAPTAGYHGLGSYRMNTAPTAGGSMGWVTTTAGSPGTQKTWGAIAA